MGVKLGIGIKGVLFVAVAVLTGCESGTTGPRELDDGEDERWHWDAGVGPGDVPHEALPEPQSAVLAAVDREPLQLRDVDGEPLTGYTWTVDDPGMVEVDAAGFVTALGPIGVTQLWGEKNGSTLGPIQVLTADLVDDVWTYEDVDVMKSDPWFSATDSDEDDAAWRFIITSAHITPSVGDVLLSTGDYGASGEVIAASPNIWNPAQTVVRVRPTDLTDVFEELDVDLTVDAWSPVQQVQLEGEIPNSEVFFWECTEEAAHLSDSPIEIHGGPPSIQMTGKNGGALMRFSARIGGGQRHLIARINGEIKIQHQLGVEVEVEGDFSVTCDYELLHVPLPTHPALSFLVADLWMTGGMGVEARMGAKLEALEWTLDTKGTIDVDVGFEWHQGGSFQTFNEVEPEFSVTPKLDIELGTAVSVTPEIYPHVYLTLHGQAGGRVGRAVANVWRKLFKKPAPPALEEFELLKFRAGLSLAGEFWRTIEQLLPYEPPEQSTYGLYKKFDIGTDPKLRKLVGRLGLEDSVPLAFELTDPLWSSPTGHAFIDVPSCMEPGESLPVQVVLDADTVNLPLIGIPNVERITLRHSKNNWHNAEVDAVSYQPGQLVYQLLFVPEPGDEIRRESIAVFVETVAAPNLPMSLSTASVREVLIKPEC